MPRSRHRGPRSGQVSAREERRRLAFRLLRARTPKATIARQLGVSYVTVWKWEKRWHLEGPDSWRDHDHPGSKRRLSAKDQRALLAVLKKGARTYGYPTELWTLKRVAEVIREEYGVEYTLSGVWRVLRSLGLSAQVPPTISVERDEAYIREWVPSEWPEMVDRARKTRSTLVFVAEADGGSGTGQI